MEKLQTINECPEFFKEGPLAEYLLEITPLDCNGRYAIYDGSKLRKDINQQRGPTGSGSIDPALVSDLREKFWMNRPRSIRTGDLIEVGSFPDYLQTCDSIEMLIFTANKDQLSQDLFDYFQGKITFVFTKDRDKERVNNVCEKTLSAVKKTLFLEEGHGDVDPMLSSRSPGVFDVLFSIHQGIENQIRFTAAEDCKDFDYPFLDLKGKKYFKSLYFTEGGHTKGNVRLHCVIGTQLDLLEYLKSRGHSVGLQLSQNGIVKDSVKYSLFAI